jgi:hypothetical protein
MRQSGFDLLIKTFIARDEIVYAGFSVAAVITFDSLTIRSLNRLIGKSPFMRRVAFDLERCDHGEKIAG